MVTMVHQQAISSSDDLDQGFQHLVYHNSHAPFNSPQDRPRSQTEYTTQNLIKQELPFYENYLDASFTNSQLHDVHHGQDMGLGIHYTHLSEDASEYTDTIPSSYPEPPFLSSSVPEHMPPTPKSSGSETVKRTRSSRAIRSASPYVRSTDNDANRIGKSPRPKKVRQPKGTTNAPKLDAPLSILTKDMKDVPVRDMEAWVNRSAETRMKEVEKKNGHIVRPMNSFMLYRAAYQDRTKAWCAQNNHQVVSAVSGESWPKESKEVREFYNELAKLERANHARAHPTYKFSPSKAGAKNKKKMAGTAWNSDDDDEEGELSGNDDPDWEWRPRHERRALRSARRSARNATHSSQGSPLAHEIEFGIDAASFNSPPVWDPVMDIGHAQGQPEPSPFYHQHYYYSPPMAHSMMPPTPQHPSTPFNVPSGMPGLYQPEGFQHAQTSTPLLQNTSPLFHQAPHHYEEQPHNLPDAFRNNENFDPDTMGIFEMQVDPSLLGYGDHNGQHNGSHMMPDSMVNGDSSGFGGGFDSWVNTQESM